MASTLGIERHDHGLREVLGTLVDELVTQTPAQDIPERLIALGNVCRGALNMMDHYAPGFLDGPAPEHVACGYLCAYAGAEPTGTRPWNTAAAQQGLELVARMHGLGRNCANLADADTLTRDAVFVRALLAHHALTAAEENMNMNLLQDIQVAVDDVLYTRWPDTALTRENRRIATRLWRSLRARPRPANP